MVVLFLDVSGIMVVFTVTRVSSPTLDMRKQLTYDAVAVQVKVYQAFHNNSRRYPVRKSHLIEGLLRGELQTWQSV